MKIGNIITERDIKINNKFNIVNSIDKIIPELPTLIVGMDITKKYYTNISYLNRKINDTTFWTFTKLEKRDLHEEDLYYFIEFAYKNLLKNVKFTFIDLILNDTTYIKSIFDEMSKNKIITFKDKNNIYLYFKNNIYGFDLRQVSFIGKSIESFMDKIKSLSNVFLEDSNILIEYKKELLIFNEEIKYIPLIYSLNKNE
jgi:hypothetical protein